MDKKENEYNWVRTLSIGFVLASAGIALAVILYLIS